MTTMSGTVTPWYRQPWPWLLMIMPVLAVVGGALMIWFAVTTDDGVVDDDYYKQGLAINQKLSRQKLAQTMGLSAKMSVSGEKFSIILKSDRELEFPQRIMLHLNYASNKAHDLDLVLERAQVASDSVYVSDIKDLKEGHWYVSLEDEGSSWRLSGSFFYPKDRELDIAPQ